MMDTEIITATQPAPDASQVKPLSTAIRHQTIVNQCHAKIYGFNIRHITGLAPDDLIALAADLDSEEII